MPRTKQLKRLSLVGMAPPGAPRKRAEQPPCPSGKLTDYVALDPRHGVFPNLVMTPLLATLYHLRSDATLLHEFMDQIVELLEDNSPRRHNILLKPTENKYELDPRMVSRLKAFRTADEVWLVFGFRPISALLSYLLHGSTMEKGKDEFERTARTFLGHAIKACPNHPTLPSAIHGSAITPLPGIFFYLCTTPDPDSTGVVAALHHAALAMTASKSRASKTAAVLRSIIPLPHNEAYDRYPIASGQNAFMLCRTPKEPGGGDVPPEIFWRYIGQRIAIRLQC